MTKRMSGEKRNYKKGLVGGFAQKKVYDTNGNLFFKYSL